MGAMDEILQRLATLEERTQNQIKAQENLQEKIDAFIQRFEEKQREQMKEIVDLKLKMTSAALGGSTLMGAIAAVVTQYVQGKFNS